MAKAACSMSCFPTVAQSNYKSRLIIKRIARREIVIVEEVNTRIMVVRSEMVS